MCALHCKQHHRMTKEGHDCSLSWECRLLITFLPFIQSIFHLLVQFDALAFRFNALKSLLPAIVQPRTHKTCHHDAGRAATAMCTVHQDVAIITRTSAQLGCHFQLAGSGWHTVPAPQQQVLHCHIAAGFAELDCQVHNCCIGSTQLIAVPSAEPPARSNFGGYRKTFSLAELCVHSSVDVRWHVEWQPNQH